MPDARVLHAERNGICVIRLEGQVRMTMCPTLEEFVERMFADATLRGVVVDVSAAESLDSTTLGVLARLSRRAREQLHDKPALCGASPDVRRVLDSCGLDDQFHFLRNARGDCEFERIVECDAGEDEMRRCVIAAHRELMALSEHNRETFSSLVATLESGTR
jgi:anti-anti-sigma factor